MAPGGQEETGRLLCRGAEEERPGAREVSVSPRPVTTARVGLQRPVRARTLQDQVNVCIHTL